MPAQLPLPAYNLLRNAFRDGKLTRKEVALQTGLAYETVRRYWAEFTLMQKLCPERLPNLHFRLFPRSSYRRKSEAALRLPGYLPALVDRYQGTMIKFPELYKAYLLAEPQPLSWWRFAELCGEWFEAHQVCFYAHRRVREVKVEDQAVLQQWLYHDDLDNWKRAMVVSGSFEGKSVKNLVGQLDLQPETVLHYLDAFNRGGVEALRVKGYRQNAAIAAKVKLKQERMIRLVHEPPSQYGINRTSWTFEWLASSYAGIYGEPMAAQTARALLKKAGYTYNRSKELLTSTDKKYNEKVAFIKNILANLTPDERFFSIDEFGPFGVKKRGGRTICKAGEEPVVPEAQKSKGSITLVGALELLTNQLTWIRVPVADSYSTVSMIRLLTENHFGCRTIYLSWDTVIWHRSKVVKEAISKLNEPAYRAANGTPNIVLAPLPSAAQFLNVIESVFIGMARAVLKNSDYRSADECFAAIEHYFHERNAYFNANPKRAGNKIWRGEVVPPAFDESKHSTSKRKVKTSSACPT